MTVVLLAHWWDGQWGTMARRDVWVEQLDDGRYQVRWRGGGWTDRDGSWRSTSKLAAWGTVRALIGDGAQWRRSDAAT